jgi:hypothetical protein
MRHIILTAAVALGLALPAGAGEPKQPPKETVDKGQAALKEHLDKIKGTNGQILRIEAGPLNELFPKAVFFAVRFRVYPVAVLTPPGMKPSNVFVYDNGKLTHLKDELKLNDYFVEKLPAVMDDAAAKKVAQAWVWLTQEFVQDGFYTFAVPDDSTKVADEGGKKKATAKATVTKGGNGEVHVNLTFTADGKMTGASYGTKLRPGPRPICQATKLLDPDPIVRRMAEQDLLYMGLAAREYLAERRALAGPELRREIDRLWQRIEREGW